MTRSAPRTVVAMVMAGASGCDSGVQSLLPDALSPEAQALRWQSIPAPAVNLFAVSGTGAGEVVIVGGSGTILRWDGTALFAEPSGTEADLYGVFCLDADVAYAVGQGGVFLRRDKGAWTVLPEVTRTDLRGVWADASQAIAVGARGIVVRWDGVAPMQVPSSSPDDLFAVTKAEGEIFAVGTLGTTTWWDGGGFVRASNDPGNEHQPIPGFNRILAGATTGPGGTIVVGLDGAVFRYAGGAFTMVPGAPPVFLRSVAAPSEDVYVVGWDETLVRLRDADVHVYEDLPDRWLYGVFAPSPSEVWVVGAAGTVLRGPPAEVR